VFPVTDYKITNIRYYDTDVNKGMPCAQPGYTKHMGNTPPFVLSPPARPYATEITEEQTGTNTCPDGCVRGKKGCINLYQYKQTGTNTCPDEFVCSYRNIPFINPFCNHDDPLYM
jgi:hypothetical protein